MKAEVIRQATQTRWAGGFRVRICTILLLMAFIFMARYTANAQACSSDNIFYHGERIDYDLYFKWGLLTSKAGLARFTLTNKTYQSNDAWEYRLQFHSMGMLETFYKMRDTLTV